MKVNVCSVVRLVYMMCALALGSQVTQMRGAASTGTYRGVPHPVRENLSSTDKYRSQVV